MSFVLAAPEAQFTAASDLAGIGSSLSKAAGAAAPHTNGVLAAAADEVSTQVAELFSAHGLQFQQLTAQASAYHEQFVQALTASAKAYVAAEANAAQTLSGSALGTAAHHLESAVAGNAGAPSGGTMAAHPSTTPTGGSGAVNPTSSALSPAAATHPAASTAQPEEPYYYGDGYYPYYGYGLVGIWDGFISTLLYDPFYLPIYMLDVILDLPYWLLGGYYY